MRISLPGLVVSAVLVAGVVTAPTAVAAPAERAADRADRVVAHWSPARTETAQPRDLLVDERGLGYQRRTDGRLEPHGHATPAAAPAPTALPAPAGSTTDPTPRGKPAAGDSTGPAITATSPPADAVVGASQTFTATVTDPSGVRAVTVVVTGPAGRSSTFAAATTGNGVYSVTLGGLTDGTWTWAVQATDGKRNRSTAGPWNFGVATTPAPPAAPTVVANAPWTAGGAVQQAAGRIYFEMPTDSTRTRWSGYVCSGTVVRDGNSAQSVVLTAAHCVYDDVTKTFARNVLFIPNQDATTGTATDQDCGNDPMGCWVPSYGVVDAQWTTRTFPDNIPWDYAYYVVPGPGAHRGAGTEADLERAAGALPISFADPRVDVAGSDVDRTTALGYSYSADPDFMHCAEDLTTEGAANWWLPTCGLSGGASGGPWVQPMVGGGGPVVSVNSWGYTDRPGMAGPRLSGTSADDLFLSIERGLTPTAGGYVHP